MARKNFLLAPRRLRSGAMKSNPLQFAVVREDPAVERAVMADRPVERALLIASGGCTALALQCWWPEASFTLVDPNPAQLALVQRKVRALQAGAPLRERNVASDDPGGSCNTAIT